MRKLSAVLVTLAVVFLFAGATSGCKRNGKVPDKGKDGKPAQTNGEKTFTLNAGVQVGAENVPQGTQKQREITLDPEEGFDQTVTVKAEVVGDGKGFQASVDPKEVKLSGDQDKTVTLTLKADGDAKIGERTVKVTATPKTGTGKEVTLKYEVVKKE